MISRNKQTYNTTVVSSIAVQHFFQHKVWSSVSKVHININFCLLKSTCILETNIHYRTCLQVRHCDILKMKANKSLCILTVRPAYRYLHHLAYYFSPVTGIDIVDFVYSNTFAQILNVSICYLIPMVLKRFLWLNPSDHLLRYH